MISAILIAIKLINNRLTDNSGDFPSILILCLLSAVDMRAQHEIDKLVIVTHTQSVELSTTFIVWSVAQFTDECDDNLTISLSQSDNCKLFFFSCFPIDKSHLFSITMKSKMNIIFQLSIFSLSICKPINIFCVDLLLKPNT